MTLPTERPGIPASDELRLRAEVRLIPFVPFASSASVVSICRTFTLASSPCCETEGFVQLYGVEPPTLMLTIWQSFTSVEDEVEKLPSPSNELYAVLPVPKSLPTAFS